MYVQWAVRIRGGGCWQVGTETADEGEALLHLITFLKGSVKPEDVEAVRLDQLYPGGVKELFADKEHE